MAYDFVFLVCAATVTTAAVLPGFLRPILVQAGVMDLPNRRSSHDSPAIRGIGLAPAVCLNLALFALLFFSEGYNKQVLAGALVAILGASIVGWIEDIRGIASKYRMLSQAFFGAAGTAMIMIGLDQRFWWLFCGLVIITTYVNVANFMDGINGISGAHGLLVGGYYVVVGFSSGIEILIVIGVLLAGVFAAFLPWNLLHGRMFLGDVGSYLLGSTIAVLSVIALGHGIHPVTVLGPVAIYLADTGSTLFRRMRSGERLSEAHRSHVYQRLASHGRKHWQVSLLVSALGVVSGAAGLLAYWTALAGWALGLPLILLSCVGYVVLPSFADNWHGTSEPLL